MVIEQYILIGDETYPLDTGEQIIAARQALREAGLESAPVWYGEPGSPDTYKSTVHTLFAGQP